jgi:putative hemolysin
LDYHPVSHFLHTLLSPVLLTALPNAFLLLPIVVLLILSFFISGAEVAFFSLTHKDINKLKTRQTATARRIVRLLEEPKILLATMIIANSFVNLGIIIVFNFFLDPLIASVPPLGNLSIAILIKIVIVTFVLLLFCEVLPKIWATQHNLWFAYNSSGLMEILNISLGWLSSWLVRRSDGIERRLMRKNKTASAQITEDLVHAIDLTDDNEASAEEKNILKGILKFSNITVKQIMRTRLDVSGIDHVMPFPDVIRRVEELHYSRLPVYKNSLDEVVGMIHTKDLLPHIQAPADFKWQSLLRPTYFVHEQKLIEDLLQEFQAKRIHFAVVVDEFGGTSGIVTLEDVMEEIIGEIKDEFDEDEVGGKKIDDNTFVFEGKTMLNDMCKAMNLPVDIFDEVKGESDSVAGLVLEIAGEIPQVNDMLPVGDFELTVLEVNRNRVEKVKVSIRKS